MKTREARNTFINYASRIMMYRLCLATGDTPPQGTIGELNRVDDKKHDYYVDELIKEIHKLTDLEKMEVKNSGDVLKLLGQGAITITDAKELIGILHQKVEVDELPKLLEALEKTDESD